MLLGIFLMDVTYYYRLLLGMVKIGIDFERTNRSILDQTTQLGTIVSAKWAHFVVSVFYLIPLIIGISSLFYIATK
jgi:hypothetical protein